MYHGGQPAFMCEEVVHQMKQKGYNITWVVAEKKMRNLRQTHRAVRDNNSKTGRGRRSWEYFEKMEEIFREGPILEFLNDIPSPHHTLYQLLPPQSTASQKYNLRRRTHDRQLHDHQGHLSDCNFITRLLYRDSY